MTAQQPEIVVQHDDSVFMFHHQSEAGQYNPQTLMIGNKRDKDGNRLIVNRVLDKSHIQSLGHNANFSNANTNTTVADKVGNMFVAYWYQAVNGTGSNNKIIKFNSEGTVISGTGNGIHNGSNDEMVLATNGEQIFFCKC